MTGGTGTENTKDVTPVINEVTEAKQELDRVTIEPVAAVEKGDIQQSEDLQKAFVAVVPPVQALETPPAPQESAPEPGQDSGGKSGLGNQNTNPADNYSGVKSGPGGGPGR